MTVQGPVKEQQPDGMSHGGLNMGGGGNLVSPPQRSWPSHAAHVPRPLRAARLHTRPPVPSLSQRPQTAIPCPFQLLQWEICKTTADAAKEFDRTMDYIDMTIAELMRMHAKSKELVTTGGVVGQLGRGPLGVMLCMGPFNYPFNETYCQFIPSLLMGNTVVMKIPTTGGLAHILTMEVRGGPPSPPARPPPVTGTATVTATPPPPPHSSPPTTSWHAIPCHVPSRADTRTAEPPPPPRPMPVMHVVFIRH